MITKCKNGGGYFLKNTNKKKGFTLIELLAVIVIIALVAVITIPIVGNIVEGTKKSAAKDSAYGYFKAIEYSNSSGEFNGEYGELEDGTYRVSELNLDLNLKGNKPTYGNITIKNGMVESANICIGGYIVNYDGTEATVGSKCIETEDTTGPNIVIGTISGTTNSLTIPFTAQDEETGIESVECLYSLDTSYKNKGKIEDNVCKLTGLESKKTYNFKIVAVNNAGQKGEAIGSKQTENFSEIEIVPNTTDWSTSKIVTITGNTEGATLEYRVVSGTTERVAWTTYKDKIIIDWAANTEVPTYIYARFYDGKNYSEQASLTITKVDITGPTLTLGTEIPTTKSAVIPISTNSDSESGIKNTTCVYGTSTSYGLNGTIGTNNCSITGLKNNTTYYYKIVTTNNAGTETTKTGSFKTGEFAGITITPNTTNWSTSKTVTITGNTEGATLEYRVVSGTTEKVAWTTYKDKITIDWTANTEVPTYIYARFYDGKNYSEQTSLTITTIDRDAPSCTNTISSYTLDSVTVNMNCTDIGLGISRYYYSIDDSEYIESTSSSYKFSSLHVSTIKLKVSDNLNNYKEFTLSKDEINNLYNNIYILLDTKLKNLENNPFLQNYPVGSIYITTSSDENTASKMSSKYGGTWESYASGRVLKGTTGESDEIGGSNTVSLAISNLPVHNHSIPSLSGSTASSGSHTHTVKATGSVSSTFTGNTETTSNASLTGSMEMHNYASYTEVHNVKGIVTSGYTNSNTYFTPKQVGGINGAQSIGVINIDASHTHTVKATGSVSSTFTGNIETTSSSGSHTHSVTTNASTTGNTGSSSSISVLDPYITVYMYKRVK